MQAQHINQAAKKLKRVYLVGAANTAYKRGTALMYNRDYGVAATREGSRDKRVEPPTTSNNLNFAGVLDHDVTLDSTGQGWVTICEPGGVADIALGSDSVIDSTHLWFTASAGGVGRFRADRGIGVGRGCAKALQTNAGGVIGESIDGTAVVTGTAVLDTGLFANAVAGDLLVILSTVQADGDEDGTPGVYVIESVTDDNNAVLAASASAAATEFMGYVISGNPTCLAYLFDGEETGGIEWLAPLDNLASQAMVGGFTHVQGGITMAGGDATSTLADGTVIGQKKGYQLHGALTTQDYLVTVTTGEQFDGTTNLQTLELDDDGDESLVEWRGTAWHLIANSGTVLT